jgi:NAD-dependent SIR2 family protein deacetylase
MATSDRRHPLSHLGALAVLKGHVPNVSCPSCGLSSYAVTPHSTASLCPYCDAELFPRIVRPGTGAPAADETPAACVEAPTAEAA